MANDTLKVRCENCGATFSAGTKTCRTCGATLPTFEKQQEDEMLEGMPLSDWREFIGPRSNNYIEIFKKHEGKAIFLSFNPWALLFGMYWMFYRKMYKLGAAILALTVFISCFVGAIVVAAHAPELKNKKSELAAYSEYIDENGKKTLAYPKDSDEEKPILSAYYAYKNLREKVYIKALLFGVLSSIPVTHSLAFLLSLFFYREHILNRTARRKGYVANSGEGGVSWGGVVFLYLFGETLSTLSTSLIFAIISAML